MLAAAGSFYTEEAFFPGPANTPVAASPLHLGRQDGPKQKLFHHPDDQRIGRANTAFLHTTIDMTLLGEIRQFTYDEYRWRNLYDPRNLQLYWADPYIGIYCSVPSSQLKSNPASIRFTLDEIFSLEHDDLGARVAITILTSNTDFDFHHLDLDFGPERYAAMVGRPMKECLLQVLRNYGHERKALVVGS